MARKQQEAEIPGAGDFIVAFQPPEGEAAQVRRFRNREAARLYAAQLNGDLQAEKRRGLYFVRLGKPRPVTLERKPAAVERGNDVARARTLTRRR